MVPFVILPETLECQIILFVLQCDLPDMLFRFSVG